MDFWSESGEKSVGNVLTGPSYLDTQWASLKMQYTSQNLNLNPVTYDVNKAKGIILVGVFILSMVEIDEGTLCPSKLSMMIGRIRWFDVNFVVEAVESHPSEGRALECFVQHLGKLELPF